MAQQHVHANQFVFCCPCSDYNHNVQLNRAVQKGPFYCLFTSGALHWTGSLCICANKWLCCIVRCTVCCTLCCIMRCTVCCQLCCTLCCTVSCIVRCTVSCNVCRKREALIELQQHSRWSFRRSEASHLAAVHCTVIYMLHCALYNVYCIAALKPPHLTAVSFMCCICCTQSVGKILCGNEDMGLLLLSDLCNKFMRKRVGYIFSNTQYRTKAGWHYIAF